jgi:hypothetical protein
LALWNCSPSRAQAFCYDEQNRLTWASSQTGSALCGGIVAGGSLSAAYYTTTYAYDALLSSSSRILVERWSSSAEEVLHGQAAETA